MPIVISVANEKGGVGKTDLSINLASYLAQEGKKVLLIDLDPQANATRYLLNEESSLTSANVLMDLPVSVKDAVRETNVEGLSLLPASNALSVVQLRLAGEADMQFKLKRKLGSLDDDYEYILIDTPPSLGTLTINALTASNFVIVPLQAHYLALYGINDLMETISKLKYEINPNLELLGVVLTMYDKRTRISKDVEAIARERFSAKLFTTIIPVCVKAAESPSHHKPVMMYAPASIVAQSYKILAKEVLKCVKGCEIILNQEQVRAETSCNKYATPPPVRTAMEDESHSTPAHLEPIEIVEKLRGNEYVVAQKTSEGNSGKFNVDFDDDDDDYNSSNF